MTIYIASLGPTFDTPAKPHKYAPNGETMANNGSQMVRLHQNESLLIRSALLVDN